MTEREFRANVMPLRRLMYGLALRMGIPPDDAADAVQETQIRLWCHRESIPVEDKELKLYCMASMRNECLTRIRRQKSTEQLNETVSASDEVYETFDFNDTKNQIERIIETLPKGQQDVIRLSAFGECDTEEIAKILGQTKVNVRQLLSRGRKRIRELIGER